MSHEYSSVHKECLGFQGKETHKTGAEKSYHVFRLQLESEKRGGQEQPALFWSLDTAFT